ncbi:unnamed protein product [Mycena citricolor]|uniref:Uncharacterized protein n=1 Tax=Mycena citricolor TaxID=2018698 RepID=A0AAD2GXR3_9AGAR|nr:unnamed protein product [Mycena citricolor]
MTTTVSQFSHPHSHTSLLKPNTSITHQTHYLIITPSTCHSGLVCLLSGSLVLLLLLVLALSLAVYLCSYLAVSAVEQNEDGTWDVKAVAAMRFQGNQLYFYLL